jgi:2-polyprenyl-3-methyl-5-hydroxy-6-metoxy-1,4-benzoquinol methylase
MPDDFRILTACRCCGSTALKQYLDLGEQPLANAYHHGEPLPRFPLAVNYCRECFHSQLSVAVDPRQMFGQYLYVTGTSATLRAHHAALAEDAVCRLGRSGSVLDIACNDGTLLECFRALGCDVQGVDPAENLRDVTRGKGIPVAVDYWGTQLDLGQRFHVITATNVFAHVADLADFLEACRRHLNKDGVVVIEVPYCRTMLGECHFDTIYHEHLSYFLAAPFLRLIGRCGFHAADVVPVPIHGGSLRWVLRTGSRPHCQAAADLAEQEGRDGFLAPGKYTAFAQAAEQKRAALRDLLADGLAIGYGAAAKANTLLNFCGLNLRYIVDDNPLKWGYLTPGRDIPIVEPARLAGESGNLMVLLLAWTFESEVRAKLQWMRRGDSIGLVHCVPTVRMERVQG